MKMQLIQTYPHKVMKVDLKVLQFSDWIPYKLLCHVLENAKKTRCQEVKNCPTGKASLLS